jgi:hypothetical protein
VTPQHLQGRADECRRRHLLDLAHSPSDPDPARRGRWRRLPFEPYMLLSAARAEGSLVPGIKYVLVPNRRPPNREGHLFIDNTDALTDAVSAWLAEQHM